MLALLAGIPVVGPLLATVGGFAVSPVGRWLMIGIAAFVFLQYREHQAADRARSECRAAVLEKTIAELERQNDVYAAAEAAAERREAEDDVHMATLEEKRREMLEKLKTGVPGQCGFDADTLRRLRDIK